MMVTETGAGLAGYFPENGPGSWSRQRPARSLLSNITKIMCHPKKKQKIDEHSKSPVVKIPLLSFFWDAI